MPYASVKELPAAQVRKYSPHQRQAFMEAFNAAHDSGTYPDEASLFKIAHRAAKKAGTPRRIAFRKLP